MTDRKPVDASFEAQPLRPGGQRRDPLPAIVAVVVLAIGLAVVKPWGGDGASVALDPSGGPSESAAGPLASTPASRVPGQSPSAGIPSAPPVAWRQVATVLTPRDRWGIRAVVATGEGAGESGLVDGVEPGLAERWRPVGEADQGSEVMILDTGDRPVVALGITFPPDELPLDLRVWQAAADGGWAWAGAAPLTPAPALGGALLGPPRLRGVQLDHWPAGRYRVDVLVGDAVLHHHVGIPGRFDRVPAAQESASVPDVTLVSPFSPTFRPGAGAVPGPFVVEDGQVTEVVGGSTPVDAPEGEGTSAARLWRDGAPSIAAPRATGLGVLLPDGATEATATLRTTAPDDAPTAGRRVLGIRLDAGRMPFVIFRAPGGAAWPAGTYLIDAAWTEGGERRDASYPIVLLPGPPGPPAEPSAPLVALRSFASAAGRPDTIVGIPAFADAGADLTCLEGTNATITESPAMIGIGHAAGAPPDGVTATLRLAGGRTAEQPLLVAREPVVGLSLIAPATADAFVPGVYRLRIETGDAVRTHTLCPGVIVID